MPESPEPVKELAKELAKESAKKIKSSILSAFGFGNEAKPNQLYPPSGVISPTTHPTAATVPSPRRDDLVESFDALALAGRRVSDDRPYGTPGFIGGFDAPPSESSLPPRPPNENLYSSFNSRNYNPSFPIPDIGPLPRPPMPIPPSGRQQSLTMQHALASTPPTSAPGYPGPDIFTTNTPPPRPHSTPHLQPPSSGSSASPQPTPVSSPRPTPKRSRSSSTPPSLSGSPTADALQCTGVTKAGKRCTRMVKTGPALSQVSPDADVERFCHQHTKEVLSSSGFYSKKTGKDWVKFEDWIPDYLQPDTQAALRVEMDKPHSPSDVPGYIYTFEIRDPNTPDKVKLKVGRAVNLVKRIDQWGKQCGSKEQVLRGWWPGSDEDGEDAAKGSMMKGRVKAGDKGSYCHRLERLVHLELADLAVNAPYLDPHFPKVEKSDTGSSSARAGGSTTPTRKSAAGSSSKSQPCADCGQVHKEIFVFTRVQRGRYEGKEWESIVKPVIEKWGAFVEAYV